MSMVSFQELMEEANSGGYAVGLHSASANVDKDYNPYEVVGSGLAKDVLAAGRVALTRTVQRFMSLYGVQERLDELGGGVSPVILVR
jgi:hypothetical protein